MVPYEGAVGSHVPVMALADEAGSIAATSARTMSARPLTAVKHTRRVLADLAALAQRRDLLADFAWRELRARYKGSALGFAWNFLMPLSQLIVFWVLFGVLLGTRPRTATGEQPYAIFLFVGLLPWTFFANSLQLGVAYLLAAANVFFRDVEHILGVLLMAWYFLTPVLFPASILDDRPQERFLLDLNPMTGIVTGYHQALLDGLPPEWAPLLWSVAFAALAFLAGFGLFHRSKDDFESAL